MAKLTVESLKSAYEELIDVLGLVDKKKKPLVVPADADGDFLRAKIVEVITTDDLIQPDDEFSPETAEVIEILTDDNDAEIEEAEEEEPEPEEKPTRKAAAKVAPTKAAPVAKEKKGPIKKAGAEGKPGIIATIVSMIEGSGKKGVTKAEILAELMEQFPERPEQSMKNTINVQVPARINKEKFPLKKIEGDRYVKA